MTMFSIITVCYNAADTIEQTILSVRDQTYKDFEHIIIDGGSKDGTLDLIQQYRDGFSVVVSEPDNGIYDAMNKGIKRAKGDFIAILNADDFYMKNTLALVKNTIDSTKREGIYYGKLVTFDYDINDGYVVAPLNVEHLKSFMCLNHPTCFVHRNIYALYTYNSQYKSAADQDLFLILYENDYPFINVAEVLTAMRKGGMSSNYASYLEIWRIQKAHQIGILLRTKTLMVNTVAYLIAKMPLTKFRQFYKSYISNKHEKYNENNKK